MNTARRSGRSFLGFLAVILYVPATGYAQLIKHVKQVVAESTARKVAAQEARAETTVVKASGKITDSALTKTNRGLTATVEHTSAGIDTALNRSERAIAGLFSRSDVPDQLASDLGKGRAVLPDVVFGPAGADLSPSADATLTRLSALLNGAPGAYLLEGHVDPSADRAADQRLSEARALAVKRRLVALGVSETRLFTMGLGSTRPAMPPTPSARIEIAKMQ